MKLTTMTMLGGLSTARKLCDGDHADQARVVCSGEEMRLILPQCAINNYHIDVENVFMAGRDFTNAQPKSNCFGNAIHGDEWHFATGPSECGTIVSGNDTHIVYTNILQGTAGKENAVITRSKPFYLEFTCVFEAQIDVTLGGGSGGQPAMRQLTYISTKDEDMEIKMDHAHGEFDLSMNLYTSQKFQTPVVGLLTLNIPDDMYIGLQLENAGKTNRLLMKECWATPSEDPEDDSRYVFLDDYCGHKAELESEALTIFQNGEHDYARFSLSSFDWFSDEEALIYLHCTVKVCDVQLEPNGSCKPQCNANSRRRRSFLDQGHGFEARVDLGPIYLGRHNPTVTTLTL